MEEARKKVISNFLNGLSDEHKEFAKKCNDFGELFDYLGREGVELPDELVDLVTGGMSQVVPVGNGSRPSIYF